MKRKCALLNIDPNMQHISGNSKNACIAGKIPSSNSKPISEFKQSQKISEKYKQEQKLISSTSCCNDEELGALKESEINHWNMQRSDKGNECNFWFQLPAAHTHSPFAGCQFQLTATVSKSEFALKDITSDNSAWLWRSKIYHPLLSAGRKLCPCIISHAKKMSESDGQSFVQCLLSIVGKLVIRPIQWSMCEECKPDLQILSEAMARPDFFLRKARVYTPGARPLDDSDIVGGNDFASGMSPITLMHRLLKTGEYSDLNVEIISSSNKKTSFKCHRTILANKSKTFETIFKSRGDHGRLQLKNTDEHTFARLLEHIYTGNFSGKESMNLSDFQKLGSLAHACQVEDLRLLCWFALKTGLSVHNVGDLLLANQQYKEPSHTEAILGFISSNLHEIVSLTSWTHVVSQMKGDAQKTLIMLSRVVHRKTPSPGPGDSSISSKKRAFISEDTEVANKRPCPPIQ